MSAKFTEVIKRIESEIVPHNDLSGIQGGITGSYYHSNQPDNTTNNVIFNSISVTSGSIGGVDFDCVKNNFYVDNKRTDSYTEVGTENKPFKTIMGAINKIISNGDNSWTNAYVLKIATGVYTENVVLEDTHLWNLIFEADGFRQTRIEPASGLALSCTKNNDNLAWLLFRNICFCKGMSIVGENSNQWLGYNMFFEDCYWSAGAVLFQNLSYPIFWGNNKFSNSTLKFSNCTQVSMIPYVEIGSVLTNFTIETDQTGGVKTPKDWTNGTKILMIGDSAAEDPVWNLVNITTWTGTALQIRSMRFGASGHTIPANATLLAYNSTLVGNYINNGTLSLYGSFISGTLTNNATLNLYQQSSLLKNDSSVMGTTIKDALNTLQTNKQNNITSGTLSGTTNQITVTNGINSVIGSGVVLSLPTDVYINGNIYSNNKIVVEGSGTIGQVAQFNSTNTLTGITEKTAFNVDFETDLGNIKTDGSVSLGALNTVARADHIHQTFTVQESNMFLNDVATLNASISKHGFLPRLSGSGTQYLDGNGNYTTPSISSFSGTISQNVSTITTDYSILTSDRFLYVTSSGRTLTLPTTSGTIGNSYTIDNASTGYIYLIALNSGLIQGEYTQTISSDSSISVYNPGTGNWRIY